MSESNRNSSEVPHPGSNSPTKCVRPADLLADPGELGFGGGEGEALVLRQEVQLAHAFAHLFVLTGDTAIGAAAAGAATGAAAAASGVICQIPTPNR